MTACKPSPEFFREVAAMLSVETSECLMVGDDPLLDLSAADVGMRTFYVGVSAGVADYRGDLHDLARQLPAIAGLES
jgi:FMN phosphatase YigB (HAD superfamily)